MGSLNLFLGFQYERGEVEKVKQFGEGHFDAFFNNNSYPCCGCNCSGFCFGGGVATSGYRFIFSCQMQTIFYFTE